MQKYLTKKKISKVGKKASVYKTKQKGGALGLLGVMGASAALTTHGPGRSSKKKKSENQTKYNPNPNPNPNNSTRSNPYNTSTHSPTSPYNTTNPYNTSTHSPTNPTTPTTPTTPTNPTNPYPDPSQPNTPNEQVNNTSRVKQTKKKRHRPKFIKQMLHDNPVSVSFIKRKISYMPHIKQGQMNLYDLKILFLYLKFVEEYINKGQSNKYSRIFSEDVFYKIITDYHLKKLFKVKLVQIILANINHDKTDNKYVKVFNLYFRQHVSRVMKIHSDISLYDWVEKYYMFLFKHLTDKGRYNLLNALSCTYTFTKGKNIIFQKHENLKSKYDYIMNNPELPKLKHIIEKYENLNKSTHTKKNNQKNSSQMQGIQGMQGMQGMHPNVSKNMTRGTTGHTSSPGSRYNRGYNHNHNHTHNHTHRRFNGRQHGQHGQHGQLLYNRERDRERERERERYTEIERQRERERERQKRESEKRESEKREREKRERERINNRDCNLTKINEISTKLNDFNIDYNIIFKQKIEEIYIYINMIKDEQFYNRFYVKLYNDIVKIDDQDKKNYQKKSQTQIQNDNDILNDIIKTNNNIMNATNTTTNKNTKNTKNKNNNNDRNEVFIKMNEELLKKIEKLNYDKDLCFKNLSKEYRSEMLKKEIENIKELLKIELQIQSKIEKQLQIEKQAGTPIDTQIGTASDIGIPIDIQLKTNETKSNSITEKMNILYKNISNIELAKVFYAKILKYFNYQIESDKLRTNPNPDNKRRLELDQYFKNLKNELDGNSINFFQQFNPPIKAAQLYFKAYNDEYEKLQKYIDILTIYKEYIKKLNNELIKKEKKLLVLEKEIEIEQL